MLLVEALKSFTFVTNFAQHKQFSWPFRFELMLFFVISLLFPCFIKKRLFLKGLNVNDLRGPQVVTKSTNLAKEKAPTSKKKKTISKVDFA